MNKKGSEKYYIIIALILGLLVVGISLYFIFQEYFNSNEVNRETCRQSIVLRGSIPDVKAKIWNLVTLKDKYPLKCKTEVTEINYKNVSRAEKDIADAMVFCWWLYGNGNSRLFPESNWVTFSSCMPCARFHFSSDVADYYTNSNGQDNRIDTERMLKTQSLTGVPYFTYLQNAGGFAKRGDQQFKVEAFPGNVIFDWSSNTWIGRPDSGMKELSNDKDYKIANTYFPKFYEPKVNGDFIINVGQFMDERDSSKDVWASYLYFYFMNNQNPSMASGIGTQFISGSIYGSRICENNEGIPA